MNNRQISIAVKYGNDIYKKNFSEQDSIHYISFWKNSNCGMKLTMQRMGKLRYLTKNI